MDTNSISPVYLPADQPQPDLRYHAAHSIWLTLLCLAMALTSCVVAFVAANLMSYLTFAVLNILLVKSIWWKQFSWSYGFLASFFVLGHWLKVSLHLYFDYPFLEPTGTFAGETSAWDQYFPVVNTALIGMLSVRALLSRIWLSTPNIAAGSSAQPRSSHSTEPAAASQSGSCAQSTGSSRRKAGDGQGG